MRNGHIMGFGFYGSYILIGILVIFSVLVFLLLRNKASENPFKIELIDILKGKYASGIITADEFIERKSIIEDIKYSNNHTKILLKRYVGGEISLKEFLIMKNEIESNNIDTDTLEELAKGELSYDDFKVQSKKI